MAIDSGLLNDDEWDGKRMFYLVHPPAALLQALLQELL
jgi:hypothetical protein